MNIKENAKINKIGFSVSSDRPYFEIQFHAEVAEQVAKWFYPHHDEIAEEQILKYLIQLENLQGIVET